MSTQSSGRSERVADLIKRVVGARLAAKFGSDPDKYRRLIDMGLIDEAAIADLPPGREWETVMGQLPERVAAMVASKPSILEQLEIRPLDVLPAAAGDVAAAPTAGEAVRTVLFTDLEGFTSFTHDRGDREASRLLEDHYETVAAIVRSRGGTIVKKIGDGHMVSFEQPTAAVMAGLDVVEAAPLPLRTRAGAHLGPVMLTEDDLIGNVVNVAARVTDLASGGDEKVTVAVRDASGRLPRARFDPPEALVLHGIPEPIEVCGVHRA